MARAPGLWDDPAVQSLGIDALEVREMRMLALEDGDSVSVLGLDPDTK